MMKADCALLVRRTMLFLVGLTAALMLQPAPGWGLQLELRHPETIFPGEAFYVGISSLGALESVKVEFNGKTLWPQVNKSDQGARATGILAVGLAHKPGEALLRVEAQGAGKKTVLERRLMVEAKTYPEQRLTVASKYVSPSAEALERIRQEQELKRSVLSMVSAKRWWDCDWKRPVPGIVTSPFGLRRFFNDQPRSPHRGVDLLAAMGQPIHAAADGVVVLARDLYFSGNCVYIDHGQGVISIYAHLSSIDVQEGDAVSRAQVLGLAGDTGRVTGPHLHFGFAVLGELVDPLALFDRECP